MKRFIIFLTGFIVGALFLYGFLWYQVILKFDRVWTCQVFTGPITVEEKAKCK